MIHLLRIILSYRYSRTAARNSSAVSVSLLQCPRYLLYGVELPVAGATLTYPFFAGHLTVVFRAYFGHSFLFCRPVLEF